MDSFATLETHHHTTNQKNEMKGENLHSVVSCKGRGGKRWNEGGEGGHLGGGCRCASRVKEVLEWDAHK